MPIPILSAPLVLTRVPNAILLISIVVFSLPIAIELLPLALVPAFPIAILLIASVRTLLPKAILFSAVEDVPVLGPIASELFATAWSLEMLAPSVLLIDTYLTVASFVRAFTCPKLTA